MKKSYVFLLFTLLLVFILIIYIITNNHLINTTQSINTSLNNINNSDNVIPAIDFNESLIIPPNDYIINNINWSLNPNLEIGYIYLVQDCEPNDIVPHKFIAVGILTEIKGTSDNMIIKKQLGNVALDARRLYGPNSAICILGTNHGVVGPVITMRVYDDKVYY